MYSTTLTALKMCLWTSSEMAASCPGEICCSNICIRYHEMLPYEATGADHEALMNRFLLSLSTNWWTWMELTSIGSGTCGGRVPVKQSKAPGSSCSLITLDVALTCNYRDGLSIIRTVNLQNGRSHFIIIRGWIWGRLKTLHVHKRTVQWVIIRTILTHLHTLIEP